MNVKYIDPQLKELVINVNEIKLDDQNARKHPDRNLKALKSSLRQFKQRKPIVVQKNAEGELICRAGNGTLMATRALKREYIAAVIIEEGDSQAKAYAIADNRTNELSEWDDFQLADNINDILSNDIDLDAVGYTDKEFDKMLKKINGGVDELTSPKAKASKTEPMIVITCESEEEQESLFEQLTEDGYQCKIV
jgi:ParB-like chromosome segregation protein Spo0J